MPLVEALSSHHPVLSVEEVVALEQRIDAAGTSLMQLMLRAGEALEQAALDLLPTEHGGEGDAAEVVVLAGPGNNGGDGWAAAELLARRGYRVTLVTRDGAHALKAQPARSVANMVTGVMGAGTLPLRLLISPQQPALEAALTRASLILDCMLGTGFAHLEVREPYATWVRAANTAHDGHDTPIVSADVPSGFNAQTGVAATPCINATTTVTMLTAKPGLLLNLAAPHVGTLLVAPLQIDPQEYPAQ